MQRFGGHCWWVMQGLKTPSGEMVHPARVQVVSQVFRVMMLHYPILYKQILFKMKWALCD